MQSSIGMPKCKVPPLLASFGGKVEAKIAMTMLDIEEVVEHLFLTWPSYLQGSKLVKEKLSIE